MSKREKIFLVVQVTIAAMLAIFGKGGCKSISYVFLIIDGIISILVIANMLLAKRGLKNLIATMCVINYLQKERHRMELLVYGEESKKKKKFYNYEISIWQKQAQILIQRLKEDRSKNYISEEQYEIVLAIEKYLANNGNQETGRL